MLSQKEPCISDGSALFFLSSPPFSISFGDGIQGLYTKVWSQEATACLTHCSRRRECSLLPPDPGRDLCRRCPGSGGRGQAKRGSGHRSLRRSDLQRCGDRACGWSHRGQRKRVPDPSGGDTVKVVCLKLSMSFPVKRPPGSLLLQLADHNFILPEGLFPLYDFLLSPAELRVVFLPKHLITANRQSCKSWLCRFIVWI